MRLKSQLSFLASGLCLGLLALGSANASTISYSGTLSGDDQVQLYTYIISQASPVTFETNSYSSGGFVPVLSLFNSAGVEIGSDGADQTCYAGMHADSTTGICDDALLSENLAAGSYTLAITEFFNVPVGPDLSNGFLEQGQGNFTGPTCGTTGAFYETDIAPCVERTDAYSVNITATPEPATFWLGSVLVAAFFITRRRPALANHSLSKGQNNEQ
jgi:hypothetical protein